MMVLIHTCGADAVVATADGGRVLAEEWLPGREASEKLVPALGRLLAGAGPVEWVGVVHGPGSFTGVRVGLGAAKGLCEARGAGLVAVSRLALVEAGALGAMAVLDAGRGEFYRGAAGGKAEGIVTRAELLCDLEGYTVVTSEAQVAQSLAGQAAVQLIAEPGAAALLALVNARLALGERSDVATTDAHYLRRTDAELLEERAR